MCFAQKDKFVFTGNSGYDVIQIMNMPSAPQRIIPPDEAPYKKSVFLAGALSAVLPGAGEFYSEEYLKSAIFLGIEAAAITIAIIYDKKGDDQTSSFQAFANEHWSVNRYAKWTLIHANSINSDIDASDYSSTLWDGSGNINWSVLNDLETAIGKGTNYYSHRLAYFGEQQYYEMIGKYPQFNPGWDDFGDENTAFQYGDPVTARFNFYSGERGKANDYYNVASKAVIVIVTNHILSLFDAVWSAASFNKRLNANISLKTEQVGYRTEYFTTLNLKYNF